MTDCKYEPGQEYRTLGGRRVRLYADDGNSRYPLHGAIEFFQDGWHVHAWSRDGRWPAGSDPNDALMPPEPPVHVRWMNVYNSGILGLHRTRELADSDAAAGRIACIRIEYTEGQYDD